MTNDLKLEGNQIYYESINLSMISIIGRFAKIVKEQNLVRYSVIMNDDSGTLKAAYFLRKSDGDPVKIMMDNGM